MVCLWNFGESKNNTTTKRGPYVGSAWDPKTVSFLHKQARAPLSATLGTLSGEKSGVWLSSSWHSTSTGCIRPHSMMMMLMMIWYDDWSSMFVVLFFLHTTREINAAHVLVGHFFPASLFLFLFLFSLFSSPKATLALGRLTLADCACALKCVCGSLLILALLLLFYAEIRFQCSVVFTRFRTKGWRRRREDGGYHLSVLKCGGVGCGSVARVVWWDRMCFFFCKQIVLPVLPGQHPQERMWSSRKDRFRWQPVS